MHFVGRDLKGVRLSLSLSLSLSADRFQIRVLSCCCENVVLFFMSRVFFFVSSV